MLAALLIAALPIGYVDDARCGTCHRKQADSYRQVAMSHAFYRPRADNAIESLDGKPFFHEKSQQYFSMTRKGEKLIFSRWQLAPDGTRTNAIEIPVDWIIGSGNHARTYLYRTPSGELFQLPINWYAQTKKWGMAPGYDRADHDGITRRVRHECMFCHNAYPAAPEDRNGYWRSQAHPEELPEGLGCQRCHGPGAKHAQDGKRDSILNPGRLPLERRNDVCYECHLQAAVALPSIRKFGRDVYSFRPGAPLAEYILQLDVVENDHPRSERFEINHHPYRMQQSRCFLESKGRLSCLTCHDPHVKVAKENRAAHYRRACLSCHDTLIHEPEIADSADCTTCHMPERRTEDVVQVTMTDHRIGKTTSANLVAPREERETNLDDVVFLNPKQASQLYRTVAVLRAGGGTSAAALRKLESLAPTETEALFDLAMAQLTQKKFAALEKTAATLVEREPKNPQAVEWLGIARIALGKRDEGLALIEQALAIDPSRAQTHYNLALFLEQNKRNDEAIAHLKEATRLRPNLATAWFHLGELLSGEAAAECYRKALAAEPRFTRAAKSKPATDPPAPPPAAAPPATTTAPASPPRRSTR